MRGKIAVLALSTILGMTLCACSSAQNAQVISQEAQTPSLGLEEHGAIIEQIALYAEDVKITEDNRLVDDFGDPAKPLEQLAFKAPQSPFAFKVIGRDSQGRFTELDDDRHVCVGWANNEDFSKFIEIGSNNRSLIFKNPHPDAMELIVSYQAVPGSSTPIQATLLVGCYGDML